MMLFPMPSPRAGFRAVSIAFALLFIGLPGCGGGSAGVKAPGAASASPSSPAPASSSSAGTSAAASVASSSSAESWLTITPDSPKFRYMGRVSVSPAAALYDWANTQIEFRVNAAAIELLFNDDRNDYNLFVDGQLKQQLSPKGETSLSVSLGQGDHRVLLTKRTGPNFGAGQFLGVRLAPGGQLLELPAAPARKIEFIGDSWTVGYGNEGPGLDCAGNLRPYENSYLSFAAIAARALHAQSHLVAVSGLGAVRNYGEATPTSRKPMPSFYNRTLMGREDMPWDFQAWVPNAVVIKLGTNDHSTPPEPPADVFIQGIHDLITQVTNAYGAVPVFLVADSSLPQVVARMQTASQQQKARGNDQVHFVGLTAPSLNQLGCDWHPLVIAHDAMAAELVAAMKPLLGWQEAPGSGEARISNLSVTPFKGGAKGAYSMVFDDYCASWTSGIDDHAIPGLLENGLRAGLGAVAGECQANNFQARLRTLAEQGFEIVNHTWSHPALVACATKPDPNQACSDLRPDLGLEIDKAREFLRQASGSPVDFFVFPFNSVDEVVINHLRAQGYLGARGGSYTLNSANFNDPLKLNLLGNQADMNALADQAVSNGAFAFINLHGVADASYQPVPLATWKSHLAYLKNLVEKHELWVDTPTAIVKYNRTRALCGNPQVDANTLVFTGAQPGCDTYATGLTLSLTAEAGVSDLRPTQQGQPLPTRQLSATSLLIENLDPRYPTQLY